MVKAPMGSAGTRTDATPKPAATVIVARERPQGLEIFCVQRHGKSAFLGGAVVFPGGKLEEQDWDERWRARTTVPAERSRRFCSTGELALALSVCGCRETLEEGGIIATSPDLDALAAEEIRRAVEAPGSSTALVAALSSRRLTLDTGRLVPMARWITPAVEPRRYDTRFYLLPCPPGQAGRHDDRETTTSLWGRPADLLAAKDEGTLMFAPPTIRSLELLRPATTIDAAVAIAERQSLGAVCPEFVPSDPPMLVLPGDPLHSVAERRVGGPTRFVLRDGRFMSEEPG